VKIGEKDLNNEILGLNFLLKRPLKRLSLNNSVKQMRLV
jgi:hypothetical protein